MALTVYDFRCGGPRDLDLREPPVLAWRAGGSARELVLAEAFARAARFMGLTPVRRDAGPVDLQVGGADPGVGILWLTLGLETGATGADARVLDFLRLKTHYRRALTVDVGALTAAGVERERLMATERALADASSAISPRAVAGYLHRFRGALSRDFDFPEALACVWDALRPGALSPGSRAALLRETLPVLGLR